MNAPYADNSPKPEAPPREDDIHRSLNNYFCCSLGFSRAARLASWSFPLNDITPYVPKHQPSSWSFASGASLPGSLLKKSMKSRSRSQGFQFLSRRLQRRSTHRLSGTTSRRTAISTREARTPKGTNVKDLETPYYSTERV